MRKITFVLLVTLLMSLAVGTAWASDPLGTGAWGTGTDRGSDPWTYIEENGENGIPDGNPDGAGRNRAYYGSAANGPGFGSSFWSYADTKDSTRRAEGSYKAFLGQNGYDEQGVPMTSDLGTYSDSDPWISGSTGPHGGYSTTSNNCKTCHAVHRAGGAFKLMRSDSADDACSYCHVDDHRHASRQAYNGGSSGIYTQNGHTVGAGRSIPDSSVRQWLEPMTLSALADDADNNVSWSLRVRRYETERMKLFVYTSNASSRHEGTSTPEALGDYRYGPTLLTCMSCHQPHNATNLVWKPVNGGGGGFPNGYKLLRASPSGSLLSDTTTPDRQPNTFLGQLTGQTDLFKVTAPETDPGVANTGHDLGKSASQDDSQTADAVYTTWTQWKGAQGNYETTMTQFDESATMLSFWCADCHNLNIASNGETPIAQGTEDTASVAATFRTGSYGYGGETYSGGRYHTDRSHTAGTYYAPCMSCHRTAGEGGRTSGNLAGWESTATPADLTSITCNRCHYRTQYETDNADPSFDFPHSGADQSTKLLFDWYDDSNGEALDSVCRYCHNLMGTDM